jgi:uncharacterized protein (PEP-CTERM system associated)
MAGTATASREAAIVRAAAATGHVLTAVAVAVGALGAAPPAAAQRYSLETGISTTGTLSSNPDLAPDGQEDAGFRLDVSPYFSLASRGGRLSLSGGGALGMSIDMRSGSDDTVSFRPSGNLNASLEAVDNFFFVDARASVYSTLDNPFQATTDPFSPANTSTSYQLGLTPYIRGTLFSQFDYEVRSDNSWTDSPNWQGQYSATNTATISRAPQPLGFAFSFEQQLLQSNVEGQDLLDTQTARFSLRYAVTSNLAVGARVGAEKYNFTLTANDWQRFYGAEASWRPNERTTLEGYWEDRIFGNSWQASFSYRRPRAAFNIVSSRLVSNTPQQFATFPGLSSLVSLLDAAFTTRIPDPVERQRAIISFLSQTQLPAELLTPTFIYSENFTLQTVNSASVVLYGTRNSLAFTFFSTTTEGSAGISQEIPLTRKTRERGTEVSFNRQMTPITGLTATASWRQTDDLLATSLQTTQTQLRVESNRRLGLRTDGTLGVRYQWVESTVTNDATEIAVFATLNHRF